MLRELPLNITTNWNMLNIAWRRYVRSLADGADFWIPDDDDALTYKALLGIGSSDAAFNADEFIGASISPSCQGYMPLVQRGMKVKDIANLWEDDRIKQALNSDDDDYMGSLYFGLEANGTEAAMLMHNALSTYPGYKPQKRLKALFENSWRLAGSNYSFRQWLEAQCVQLHSEGFPPTDFRQMVNLNIGKRYVETYLENALIKLIERSFFGISSEKAAQALCGWQWRLWAYGKTWRFDNCHLSRKSKTFIANHAETAIPAHPALFSLWWHKQPACSELPPCLATACIKLMGEDVLPEQDLYRSMAWFLNCA